MGWQQDEWGEWYDDGLADVFEEPIDYSGGVVSEPDAGGWVDLGNDTFYNAWDGGTYDLAGNLLGGGGEVPQGGSAWPTEPVGGFTGTGATGYPDYGNQFGGGYGGGYGGYPGYDSYYPTNYPGMPDGTYDPNQAVNNPNQPIAGPNDRYVSFGGQMFDTWTNQYVGPASAGTPQGTGPTPGSGNPYGGGGGGYPGTPTGTNYPTDPRTGQPYPINPATGAPGTNVNVNVGGGGGGSDAEIWNQYANALGAEAQAKRYVADLQHQAAMANVNLGYTQAANDLQARMAGVDAQIRQVDAAIQNAQLDADTRRYLGDLQNQLGQEEMRLKQEGMQLDDAYRYDALRLQETLGMGQLGVSQMDAAVRAMLGMGQLGVSQQDMALRAYLGQIEAATKLQQMELDRVLGLGGLDLQRQLGLGNLGVEQGQLQLAAYLGQGDLAKGWAQLQFAQQQAGAENAMRQAEFAASLRGPRDAFAQQAYLHGLDQTGISRSVGALRGDYEVPTVQGLQAPVQPITPMQFSLDTGITLPAFQQPQAISGAPTPLALPPPAGTPQAASTPAVAPTEPAAPVEPKLPAAIPQMAPA